LFQETDRIFHRVERNSSSREDTVACRERFSQAGILRNRQASTASASMGKNEWA
jgi:hypothetical protein